MPDARVLPMWAGRTAALLGIVLAAINLRTAVAAVSPIADRISADIPLSSVGLGVIGALPPIAFAVSGVFGAGLARRFGLEGLITASIALIVVGHLLRAVAPGYALLLVGSIVIFAGIGVANILLPPLVKRYFPDRIGTLTALYVAAMAIGTAIPSSVVVPIAESGSWRVSLGLWSVVAVTAIVPWLLVLAGRRRRSARGDEVLGAPTSALRGRITRSRTAWAIAVIFSVSAFTAYGCFAWLPQILMDTAGVTSIEAGLLLTVFSLIGLPSALIVPTLVARMRNVAGVVYAGAAAIVAGVAGLLLVPATLTWLWVALAGLGPLLFPAAMVLINLRTRTSDGSVALSAFAQGVAYAIGALGPLLIGALHEVTGGWTVPLLAMLATAVPAVIAGIALRRPAFVEDEIAR